MEYTISGENITIPNTLEVDQELPDGHVTMSVEVGAMEINMTITLEDRKIEKKEQITTAAGSFDCYVITYINTIELNLGITQTFLVKQWVSKGVGLVQQETKKPNGKFVSKTILAEME